MHTNGKGEIRPQGVYDRFLVALADLDQVLRPFVGGWVAMFELHRKISAFAP